MAGGRNWSKPPDINNPLFQEAEQSVKLMIDSVAAAELDTVRKRHKEVLQVIIAMSILYLILNSLCFAGK